MRITIRDSGLLGLLKNKRKFVDGAINLFHQVGTGTPDNITALLLSLKVWGQLVHK